MLRGVLVAATVFKWASVVADAAKDGLAIALHAQSKSSLHGWVAGSEVTTRGLRRALLRRGDVAIVEILAPFAYEAATSRSWDILLVEGFSGPVATLVRIVRRLNGNVVIIHWCLDTYPSLPTIAAVDADGFLTNSRLLAARGFEVAGGALDLQSTWFPIADLAPRAFVALAVDPDEMRSNFAFVAETDNAKDLIVYLGQPSQGKKMLANVLMSIHQNVPDARLAIYGTAWDRFALWDNDHAILAACCWQGALPSDEIARLYSEASVVLGTTDSSQRRLGMVNNRVFEALACGGGRLISVEEQGGDGFPELQAMLRGHGDVVYSATSAAAAVASVLAAQRATPMVIRYDAAAAREHITDRHTYDARAAGVLESAAQWHGDGRPRPNRPLLLLVVDGGTTADWALFYGLLPALLALDHTWRVQVVDVRTFVLADCGGAALVAARGSWGGVATRAVAALSDVAACAVGSGINGEPRRPSTALFLERRFVDGEVLPPDVQCSEMLRFDAIFHDCLGALPACLKDHPNAQIALGVDVEAFRPELSEASILRASRHRRVILGRNAPWYRIGRSLSISAGGCILAFILPSWRDEAPDTLINRTGCVDVRRTLRMEAFPAALRAGISLEVPCAPQTGCAFLVLAGLASGIPLRVADDNPTLSELGQLSQASLSQLFSLESLSHVLKHGLGRALDSPRSAAMVEVVKPKPGDQIPCHVDTNRPGPVWSCALPVTVRRTDFVPPDDGVWCVTVNEMETLCQGDTKDHATANFELISDLGSAPVLQVSAVIRAPTQGDASTLVVVRRSQSVAITLLCQEPNRPAGECQL